MNNLYISKESKTMEELCNRGNFSLQKHQQFLERWFSMGNRKILLFHGLGSGKTCSSIVIQKVLKSKEYIDHVYVVTPASLKQNYRNELLGPCGQFNSIPNYITIDSYQGFMKRDTGDLSRSIVIIDEVQNVVSDKGSTYRNYLSILKQNVGYIVLLSGTPMFDKPHEIGLTLNLLNLPKPIPINSFYTKYINKKEKQLKNENDFIDRVSGYVSSFYGVSPNAYAKRVDTTILCKMKGLQKTAYKNATEAIDLNTFKEFSQNFMSGPRMVSNLCYPDGSFGSKGRKRFTKSQLIEAFSENLEDYSMKFKMCIDKIKKAKGPVFVYSNFVEAGGINDFIIALESQGFKNYKENKASIPNKTGNNYSVFRSGQDDENKEMLKIFNNPENKNGDLIKVVIGSPAMKEGITLLNTREVHLLDPYWNNSRTQQIIGRAIRFCSHIGLNPKDRIVNVYNYASVLSEKTSIDAKIMKISLDKLEYISKFEKLLYKVSVDCHLFHNANGLEKTDCVNKPKTRFEIQLINGLPTKGGETYIKNIIKDYTKNNKFSDFKFKVTVYSKKKVFEFKTKEIQKYVEKINYKDKEKNVAVIELLIPELNNLFNQPKASLPNGPMLENIDAKGKNKQNLKIQKQKKSSCPMERQPIDGVCKNARYPFIKKNCCYERPMRSSKGIQMGYKRLYINGRSATGYKKSELLKYADKYLKTKLTKPTRLDIIEALTKQYKK